MNGVFQHLYNQAVVVVMETGKPSPSLVQRRLGITYDMAKALVEGMEVAGICTRPNAAGQRQLTGKRS